jgi:hypothetical protein
LPDWKTSMAWIEISSWAERWLDRVKERGEGYDGMVQKLVALAERNGCLDPDGYEYLKRIQIH